ncbi:hypothetical protein [Jannaschia seosinensis]|uniref:hypothetical protein n=1 Tax=Jannaschia seosinensis TaxID=313367 RepID=UPI0006E1E97D|nr:hypothetical protein [Jannaschia seosinensis]
MTFLTWQDHLETISEVRFPLGGCSAADSHQAAQRGAAGQKPVGFSLFGGALKAAVAEPP